MKKLPHDTIKRIQSQQVVYDQKSVVKELVENAIDAGATNIEITLQRNGIDLIKVK